MNDAYTRAPHRQPASSGHSPNAALLIDFDNVTMGIRSNLGQELRNFLNSDIIRGKVSVQRAYADWRRYQQYIVPLSEASIDLIFAPAYGSSKKNATDIRLAIDALELVFTRPEIGTFILLSGDSDFSSMVLKLKEYGKYVIGVGLQESSSDLLVQNCDEYYSYNSLSGLTDAEDLETVRHDPWELVEQALQRMVERNDVMRSDRLKQVMLEMDSSFDEKDHGFSKFNRFLGEASSRDLVRLRKAENGQYEVRPGTSSTETASAPSGGDSTSARKRSDGGRSRSRSEKRSTESRTSGPAETSREMPPPIETSSLRDAYDLLRKVVKDRTRAGEKVRDSEVKRAMLDRDGSFDETALGFRKFSRFLHQAHDEQVVDVTRDANGNYHISVPESEPQAPGAAASAGAGTPSAAPTPGPAGATEAEVTKEREQPSREAPSPRPEEPVGATEAEVAEPADEVAAGNGADSTAAGPEAGAGEGTPERQEPRPSTRRRGGLGRFRRGSRKSASRKSESGSGDEDGAGAPLGPVDTGAAEKEETDGGETGDTAAGTGDTGTGARTGLSRGSARGSGASRQPAGEAAAGAAEKSAGEAPDEATTEAAPSGNRGADAAPSGTAGTAEGNDVIQHMVRNYAGVGRKTAEKLVEEFGSSVLDVVDSEPDRLTRVLPEHRAQAVVEARRAERA